MNHAIVDVVTSPAKVPLPASIIEHFSSIADPRIKKKTRHNLEDIIVITICAAVCGANNWVAVETYPVFRNLKKITVFLDGCGYSLYSLALLF